MKNSTKLLAVILSLLMLMSIPVTAATPEDESMTQWYCDIDSDAWYYDSVSDALELGLMKGTLTGNGNSNLFSPDDPLTREQFVTILARTVSAFPKYGIKGLHDDWETVYDYRSKFSDVDRFAWYGTSLMWAENFEVTNGVSDSEFGIGKAITREEMATLIYRYISRLELMVIPESENVPEGFGDAAETSDWAVNAVEFMRNTGIITGDGNGNFRPHDSATRAEAAAIFVRLFNSAELQLDRIFDAEKVESIVFETRDEAQGGLLRTYTLDGEEADEAVSYFADGKVLSSYYAFPTAGSFNYLRLYDDSNEVIVEFIFSESRLSIFGYRLYNYEENYLKTYCDKLYVS